MKPVPPADRPETPDICIVVLSCDKYSDLWPLFFELFFRFWPDCPFPVYLFANRQTYAHPRVKSVLSGDDPDWSTSIKSCLRQLGHRHVWLFFDDVFLDRKVDAVKIGRLVEFIARHDPAYLRFSRFPRPDERISRHFGRCREGSTYRTSLFGIWKREVLLDLLREGESAWLFEHNGRLRSSKYPDFFGVYEEYCSYIHAIERGLWSWRAVAGIRRLGYTVDLGRRPAMSPEQHRQFRKTIVRAYIFNRTPSRFKPILVRLATLSRRVIGRTLG